MKIIFFLPVLLLSQITFAGSYSCNTEGELKTPVGRLTEEICRPQTLKEETKSTWSLDKKKLVSGKYPITLEDANTQHTLFVLESANANMNGCPDQLFLVDLSASSPRVFSFGIKNACSEYHWARWSKSQNKRSVIALKNNVRFTYVNGKLIPPDDTDSDQIGMPKVYANPTPSTPPIPFVKELPLPQ